MFHLYFQQVEVSEGYLQLSHATEFLQTHWYENLLEVGIFYLILEESFYELDPSIQEIERVAEIKDSLIMAVREFQIGNRYSIKRTYFKFLSKHLGVSVHYSKVYTKDIIKLLKSL